MNNGDPTLVDIRRSHFLLRSVRDQEEFPVSGETVVGREQDCQIRIDDISVSRHHAKVFAVIDSVFVEDLHSTNGTYVNGEKIRTRQQVRLGDELRFHKHAFRLASPDADETGATLLAQVAAADDAADVPAALAARGKTAQNPEQVTAFVAARAQAAAAEIDVQSEPDHTQVLSLQKLKVLAARSASNRNPVTVGAGPRLVVLTAPLRGKVFQLPDDLAPGTRLHIGRGSHGNRLNLLLEDKTISQDHAKLELTEQGWSIKVSNAKNGLCVNGQPTRHSPVLKHNDKITMGRIELAFLSDAGVGAEDSSAGKNVAATADDKSTSTIGRRLSQWGMFAIAVCALILIAVLVLPLL